MRKKSIPTNDWFVAVAVLGIAMTTVSSADAQTLPNRLQGPIRVESAPVWKKRSPISNQQGLERRESVSERQSNPGRADLLKDKRETLLRKERFRRKAAEAALKQLEQMADQLREQLGEEVSARQAAEAVAAELLSRASLESQIDQERKRLRNEQIKILERMVEAMSKRLADERAKRQQLEDENISFAKTAAARADAASLAETAALKSRIKALERELAAAEWARKLAEAQLKVITDETGNR